jgi:hypothetical protein
MKAYDYVEAMIFTFIFFCLAVAVSIICHLSKKTSRVATPRDLAKLDMNEATVHV